MLGGKSSSRSGWLGDRDGNDNKNEARNGKARLQPRSCPRSLFLTSQRGRGRIYACHSPNPSFSTLLHKRSQPHIIAIFAFSAGKKLLPFLAENLTFSFGRFSRRFPYLCNCKSFLSLPT